MKGIRALKRKNVMKKIPVAMLLGIVMIGTCSTGFAASLNEEAVLDDNSNIIENSENKNLLEKDFEENKNEAMDDIISEDEEVIEKDVIVDEIPEEEISDEEDLEKDDIEITFADKINNIDSNLYDEAIKELSDLDADQVEQIENLWNENIFDELGAEQVVYAYTDDTNLSEKTALVLILANMDMGMNYINEYYDGNNEYLNELNNAYDEIYVNLAEIACLTKESEEYISSLQDVFEYGIEKIYAINWKEQESEENPRLNYWIFEYFEEQCKEDVHIFLSYFDELVNEE